MIIEISLKNYRSIKEQIFFSMLAESSKNKESNLSILKTLNNENKIRIINVASIYGANASGKSNFFKGISSIISFIGIDKPKAGKRISAYDPFRFMEETKKSPVEFSIQFIGNDMLKYKYDLTFDDKKVIKENLYYYPNKRIKKLFSREESKDKDSIIHIVKLGTNLNNKKIEVFENQAALSIFGETIPDKIISEVFIYLTNKIEVINASAPPTLDILRREMGSNISNDSKLLSKVSTLLKFADTGLNGININKIKEDSLRFIDNKETIPEFIKEEIMKEFKFLILGQHNYYRNNELVRNDEPLPFNEESRGTNILLALGGKLLQILESGGIIFVDELETSLHPFLSKLLICLFQSKKINTKNSQLIFTTHDTTLLDRTLFRKDQIWITEKNEKGETDLFSLQDFNDVREDTPFDKWYLAGKFGGIPNIKSLESLFEI